MKLFKITLLTAIFLSSLASLGGGNEKQKNPSYNKENKQHELQQPKPANLIEENECPICFEVPNGDNKFLTTSCCHRKLCQDCVIDISETYDQNDPTHRQYKHCPFCRKDISSIVPPLRPRDRERARERDAERQDAERAEQIRQEQARLEQEAQIARQNQERASSNEPIESFMDEPLESILDQPLEHLDASHRQAQEHQDHFSRSKRTRLTKKYKKKKTSNITV